MKYAKLELYQTALGWRWEMIASNGQPLAHSVVFYSRKRDARPGYYRTMRAIYEGVRGA